ncbi:hypothetical protein [Paenibacillus validus]|uniref:Uncharacterized protein n=1 Tax=Paenibacillus validus TaxID=44253 RepID=A0A7X2ZFI9_9BACL|nr:hypothetical protein [Paenibacillus validus]MUG73216.1 hypothetical protein [Paenibacillus validus]
MGDFRTDLERSIDEVIEKYAVNDSSLQLIEDGQISVPNAMYGVDFDKYSDHWCFRSAKVEEVAIRLDYDDHSLNFPRTERIDRFLFEMMRDVSGAVNDSFQYRYDLNSYSKFLAAPLFKYKRGNTPLIIDELKLNSLDVSIDVSCFDWVGEQSVSYDIYGRECERYHVEDFYLTIPFKDLFSKKRILEHIYDELSPVLESRGHMMDVDNITISFPGLTLDISEVNRNSFDNFQKDHGNWNFKRHASYRKDKEVLTSHKHPSYRAMVIRNPKGIQLARFVYLLKIGNWYTVKSQAFVAALLANKHPEIMILDEDECRAIQWILNYLGTEKAIFKEREIYIDTLITGTSRNWPQWRYENLEDPSKFISHFWEMRCFEEEFGNTLLSQVFN